jgi:hypothetical protein
VQLDGSSAPKKDLCKATRAFFVRQAFKIQTVVDKMELGGSVKLTVEGFLCEKLVDW